MRHLNIFNRKQATETLIQLCLVIKNIYILVTASILDGLQDCRTHPSPFWFNCINGFWKDFNVILFYQIKSCLYMYNRYNILAFFY
jgi:hypothetical protein